ncbi:MAG: VWA domain-containing protein [Terracidiphilus sp.]
MKSCNRSRSFAHRLLRLALIFGITLGSLHAPAARRVTVDEFSRTLAAAHSSNISDAELAQRIASFELTERPSTSTVSYWIANSPGEKTTSTIAGLADIAAFLNPPPADILAIPAPDFPAQRVMIERLIDFVTGTLSRLPDFFADRVTISYDDTPQAFKSGDWPIHLGIHPIGQTTAEIALLDGRETDDPAVTNAKSKPAPPGLTSWGEFGPILTVVLTDAAKGKLAWSHWEQNDALRVAVFQFSVPREHSHYTVNYCCVIIHGELDRKNLGRGDTETNFHQAVGYQGTLSIDPDTGTVARLVIQADLAHDDPIGRADIAVDFGMVRIGEKEFTCPLKSISIATTPDDSSTTVGGEKETSKLLLNEVHFQNYHHFESSARIVPPQETAPAFQNEAVVHPEKASPSDSSAQSAPNAEAAPLADAVASPSSTTVAASPQRPLNQGPEMTTSSVSNLAQIASVDRKPVLKVTSHLVNIGIFAADKKGHPVRDLTAQDFEVYDNGRKQQILFFTPPAGDIPPGPSASPASSQTFSNTAGQSAYDKSAHDKSVPASVPTTILLIDEAHIAWPDLNHIRQQILEFLAKLRPDEHVGLYSTTGNSVCILAEATSDRASLIATLQKWRPSAQSIALAQQEEMRNRQQIDEVRLPADIAAVNGNPTDEGAFQNVTDPQLRNMGDSATRDSMMLFTSVARHLAAIPGRKNLIWISSDNVFASWQDRSVTNERGPDSSDTPARHVLEAMNNAQVSVFPLDASELEGGAITADLQHRNVELTPAAADVAALGGGSTGREMTPGRNIAQMQDDTRAIQQPIQQVANATGGRVIRRAGEHAADLAQIIDEGHSLYLVSFSPDLPADNRYHTITVKIAEKRGVALRYRSGYFFAKEPETLKGRFQQAVWQPTDISEISLSANVTPGSEGATIKLTISATDLAFEQHNERWLGDLDILFIQRDDSALHGQVDGQSLSLRLTSDTYRDVMSAGIPITHLVQLGPATTSLRILIIDNSNARIGSLTIPGANLQSLH